MIESGATGPQRVAILSDTHGDLDPRITDLIAEADIAVHGGDIGGLAVLAQLQPRGGRVVAVRGNNDLPRNYPADEGHLLCHLPEVVQLALPGGCLVAIHGHQYPAAGRHAHLRRRFPFARAIVYGHSHHLIVDRDQSPWVLNPGAAGRVRTHGGPSCLILTAADGDWTLAVHRFPLSSPGRIRPFARSDKAILSV